MVYDSTNNPIQVLISRLFSGLGILARFLEEQLYRWLRAAELTCDRAALLVVQDPKVHFDPESVGWLYAVFKCLLCKLMFHHKKDSYARS